MKKKLFSILLTIIMVIGMMPSTIYAMQIKKAEYNSNVYSDMPSDWSTEALEAAINNGLLSGFGSRIMPNDNLTRAQMAAIINRAFGAMSMASLSSYTDVNADSWYYTDMSKAVQMKMFVGYNNKLNPDSEITREEVFTALARVLKLSGAAESGLDKFSDKDLVSSWAKDGTACLAAAGYIQGANGKLDPRQNITRAELAQLMDNILKKYITKEGTYTADVNGNVIINVPYVTLENMDIEGDLIIGDGVGDGDVTLNNVNVTGRTVIRGGGVDSIKILGRSDLQKIIIARVDGQLRVYTEEGLEVGEIIVDGNDDVILEGSTGTVTVVSSGITVTATKAKIESCIVEGDNSKIIVSTDSSIQKAEIDGDNSEVVVLQGASVGNITVNAKGVLISGEGKIDQVEARADNLIVSTPGTRVTSNNGATGIMAGTISVGAGNTEIVPGSNISGKNRNSRGSRDRDNDDDGRETPPVVVSAIIVASAGNTTTIANGETLQMSAAVVPANAVNKTVTWSVVPLEGGGATINAEGLLTATGVGTVRVRATNEASGVFGTIDITITAVVEDTVTSPLASYTPITFTQTGDVANDNVQYRDAAAVIAALPEEIAVTLEDSSVVNVPIIWADTDTYNASVAGDYTFTAAWGTIPVSANNNNSLVAPTVEVTVAAGIEATDSIYFTFDSATGTIIDYNIDGGTDVIIPAMIGGVAVTHIGENAFKPSRGGKDGFTDQLTSVVIPDNVTSIGNAAFAYNNLTSVVIPESVTSIGDYAFSRNQLILVRIPSGVLHLSEGAFEDNPVTEVYISYGLMSIDINAFMNCSDLTRFIVDPNNISYSSSDGVLFNKDQTTLLKYPFGKAGNYTVPEGVTSIEDYAFQYCSGLTGINIPDSVMSIGKHAFQDCTALTGSMSIPEGVTSIGDYAFQYCSGLTGINIPDSVMSIGDHAFQSCAALTGSIIIPEGVTSIESYTFTECTELTGIILPESVTSIGDFAFQYCSGLTEINIPDSVMSIGDHAFQGCVALTGSISIPEGVTRIGYSTFSNCKKLTEINIPDSVTFIDGFAFYNCNKLTGITIPSGITSISSYTFSGCTELIRITIPGGVTSIGSSGIIDNSNTSNFDTAYRTGGAGTYIRSGADWAKSASSEKEIITFSFEELVPTVIATVYEETKTIELIVPSDTDVTDLVATFTSSPASIVRVSGAVQNSGETANDFTIPVEYAVIAEDGTTVFYMVTVRRK